MLTLIDIRAPDLRAENFDISYFTFGDNRGLVKVLIIHATTQGSAAICPLGSDEFINLSRERVKVVFWLQINLADAP